MAIVAGLLFGAGLAVSGMTNPQKVLNFLDLAAIATGRWDPTLLFVFLGALPIMAIAWRVQAGRAIAWSGARVDVPAHDRPVDAPLVTGSAMFGVGWGLVGLCPGPAVAAFAFSDRLALAPLIVFFAAVMTGVWCAMMLRPGWQRGETVRV
jgi:uncharacterized membrane protein YedE/YeeE